MNARQLLDAVVQPDPAVLRALAKTQRGPAAAAELMMAKHGVVMTDVPPSATGVKDFYDWHGQRRVKDWRYFGFKSKANAERSWRTKGHFPSWARMHRQAVARLSRKRGGLGGTNAEGGISMQRSYPTMDIESNPSSVLKHELVHRGQMNRMSPKHRWQQRPPESPATEKDYYEDPAELMVHAITVADTLRSKFGKEALSVLKNTRRNAKHSTTLSTIKSTVSPKAWHRFLKYVAAYLAVPGVGPSSGWD